MLRNADDPNGEERIRACLMMRSRVLSANVFPGADANRHLTSEVGAQFQYRATGKPDKTHNLKRDPTKDYVEKALLVHDERGGMAVVSSPIWAPASNKPK